MHLQTEPATLPRIGRGDRGGDRCGDRWTRPCPLDGELHPREGFGKMLSRGLVGLCRDSQAGLSALTTADGGEWRAPSAVRGSNVLFWLLEREIPHVSRGGPHQNLVTEATKSIEIYRSAGVETELGLGKGALGRTNDRSISKGKMEVWGGDGHDSGVGREQEGAAQTRGVENDRGRWRSTSCQLWLARHRYV